MTLGRLQGIDVDRFIQNPTAELSTLDDKSYITTIEGVQDIKHDSHRTYTYKSNGSRNTNVSSAASIPSRIFSIHKRATVHPKHFLSIVLSALHIWVPYLPSGAPFLHVSNFSRPNADNLRSLSRVI